MNEKKEVVVRRANEGDLRELKRLWLLLYEDQQEYDQKFLNTKWTQSKAGASYIKKTILGRNFRTYVIASDGRLHGFITFTIVKPSDVGPERINIKLAEIEGVFIEKSFRGRDYGEKMAAKLLEWAKKRGVNRVKVAAYYHNKNGIGFYRKLGFEDMELVLERDLE